MLALVTSRPAFRLYSFYLYRIASSLGWANRAGFMLYDYCGHGLAFKCGKWHLGAKDSIAEAI